MFLILRNSSLFLFNWEHKDELTIITATLSNQIGLFIFKKGGRLKLDSGVNEVEKVESDKIEKKK